MRPAHPCLSVVEFLGLRLAALGSLWLNISRFPRFSIIFPGIREILKSAVKFVRSSIPEPAPVRPAKW